MTPLSEPYLTELDQQYVQECVASGWVSSAGPWVGRFEAALARYTGAQHVVALASGTAALHLALKVVGVILEIFYHARPHVRRLSQCCSLLRCYPRIGRY